MNKLKIITLFLVANFSFASNSQEMYNNFKNLNYESGIKIGSWYSLVNTKDMHGESYNKYINTIKYSDYMLPCDITINVQEKIPSDKPLLSPGCNDKNLPKEIFTRYEDWSFGDTIGLKNNICNADSNNQLSAKCVNLIESFAKTLTTGNYNINKYVNGIMFDIEPNLPGVSKEQIDKINNSIVLVFNKFFDAIRPSGLKVFIYSYIPWTDEADKTDLVSLTWDGYMDIQPLNKDRVLKHGDSNLSADKFINPMIKGIKKTIGDNNYPVNQSELLIYPTLLHSWYVPFDLIIKARQDNLLKNIKRYALWYHATLSHEYYDSAIVATKFVDVDSRPDVIVNKAQSTKKMTNFGIEFYSKKVLYKNPQDINFPLKPLKNGIMTNTLKSNYELYLSVNSDDNDFKNGIYYYEIWARHRMLDFYPKDTGIRLTNKTVETDLISTKGPCFNKKALCFSNKESCRQEKSINPVWLVLKDDATQVLCQ